MIRLHNIQTGWLGRLIEDVAEIPTGLVKLQVVINERPVINHETHYITRHEAIDVDALTWTVSYVVHEFTQQEITDRRNQEADVADSHLDASAVKSLLRQQVSEDEIIPSLYPYYRIGIAYPIDFEFQYQNELYRVIQAHTTQSDWKPDELPALYLKIVPPGVIPTWVQPQGAHDAYQIGDRVTHNGFLWESTHANNVWEPGVFGWSQIEPI
jgi:hypothetical protein